MVQKQFADGKEINTMKGKKNARRVMRDRQELELILVIAWTV